VWLGVGPGPPSGALGLGRSLGIGSPESARGSFPPPPSFRPEGKVLSRGTKTDGLSLPCWGWGLA
jgi:hypothetical protein